MEKRYIVERFVMYDSATRISHFKRVLRSDDLKAIMAIWVDGYRVIDSATGKELDKADFQFQRITA